MEDLAPGTILRDRYRIIRPLGKGGMGAVYLAHDAALDQQVAVKCNHTLNDQATEQFMREARLLASLRHANLPRVIDYFVLEGDQYLVMDYIPGDDLESILQKEGPQPLEKVLNWVAQIGSALVYLHSQQPPVIHRDIKPANIKLNEKGEAVLVDFGIAKAAESTQATATGAWGYTPGFAPPEQYGSGRTGPYTDQYALAATIYTLLTGQRPADSVQRATQQAVLTPMNLLRKDAPLHLQRSLDIALSIRPEERFQSVQDLVQALRDPAYLAQKTTPAPATVKAAARRGKFPVWGIIALALIGMAVLGGGAAALFLLREKPVQETPVVATAAAEISPEAAETLMGSVLQTLEVTQTAAEIAPPTTETTDFPPTAEPTRAPNWIGNGRPLVFVSDREDGKTLQVWAMKVALNEEGVFVTDDPVQLTQGEGDKTQPVLSPDGKRLLFVMNDQLVKENGKEVFLLNLAHEGQPPVNLTRMKGDDTDPAWSPDGQRIAFVNKGRFVDVHQIYLARPDGGEPKRLSIDFDESQPTWSANMEWLLYTITAQGHSYFFLRNQKLNYANPEQFDPTTFFGRLGETYHPKFSPDGKYIAYTRLNGNARQIYSVEFESRGGKASLLTPNNYQEEHPAWSPDGQWISFSSAREGNADIFIMTPTGLLQTNLTNSPGRDLQPSW
jgi:Tol biopolymer transport system component/predicted Ser/Thr protein kinase